MSESQSTPASPLHRPVAVVTGAARGIGLAIAARLAEAKMAVVISDLSGEGVKQSAAKLDDGAQSVAAYGADVSKMAEVVALVDWTLKKWGKIDVWVNNAGITRDGLMVRMSDEDWDSVLSVNLKGTFNGMKAVLPSMSKRRHGRIINIASIAGVIGNTGQANYAASKAAVVGLTKTIAREYAKRGITINAVAPGFIDTAMTASLSEEARHSLLQQIPMGRLGVPEDIAHAVAFLASHEAAYMTGQVIHVNGGMYMGN